MQEPDSERQQPTPLSRAKSKRDGGVWFDSSEDRFRQILSEVIDEKGLAKHEEVLAKHEEFSAKIDRLETSINRIMDHIDAVKRGDAEDSALRVTTDNKAADLALASVKLHPEEYFIHTTGDLAEYLEVRLHDVQKMVRDFDLFGNEEYHRTFKTGKSSRVQKYSDSARDKLKNILDSGAYTPSGI